MAGCLLMIVVDSFAGTARSQALAAAAAAALHAQSVSVSKPLSELWQPGQLSSSRPRLTGERHLLLPLLLQPQPQLVVSLYRVRLCQRRSGVRIRGATRWLLRVPTSVLWSPMAAARWCHCQLTLSVLPRLLTPSRLSRPRPSLSSPRPFPTASQSAPHPHPPSRQAPSLWLIHPPSHLPPQPPCHPLHHPLPPRLSPLMPLPLPSQLLPLHLPLLLRQASLPPLPPSSKPDPSLTRYLLPS